MNSLDIDHAKSWVRSERFRQIAIIAISALALLLAFFVGVAAGFHRAAFSYHLEQNYGRSFGTITGRFMQPGMGIPREHGTSGKIVSVTASAATIARASGPEQQVDFDADTLIRNQNSVASSSSLVAGDFVIVFGDPSNTGSIHARLIRIIPAQVAPAP